MHVELPQLELHVILLRLGRRFLPKVLLLACALIPKNPVAHFGTELTAILGTGKRARTARTYMYGALQEWLSFFGDSTVSGCRALY